jgi:hypothetical protein
MYHPPTNTPQGQVQCTEADQHLAEPWRHHGHHHAQHPGMPSMHGGPRSWESVEMDFVAVARVISSSFAIRLFSFASQVLSQLVPKKMNLLWQACGSQKSLWQASRWEEGSPWMPCREWTPLSCCPPWGGCSPCAEECLWRKVWTAWLFEALLVAATAPSARQCHVFFFCGLFCAAEDVWRRAA